MNADVTERDLLDYVVVVVLGLAFWVVESYNAASALLFGPTWTTVGAFVGVAMVLVPLYSAPVRRFRDRVRDPTGLLAAVMVVGVVLGYVLVTAVDVTIRPAHSSAFLGLALGQLLGIALYLRG